MKAEPLVDRITSRDHGPAARGEQRLEKLLAFQIREPGNRHGEFTVNSRSIHCVELLF